MKKTYDGSCHCGRVKFEVDADIDHVRVCDCSVCHKRGALNFRVHLDDLRLQSPIEEMTTYQWHTLTSTDFFCPVCGISPLRIPRMNNEGGTIWMVNVRCLADVDAHSLPIDKVYGSQLG